MVIVPILSHAEFGRNDFRENAPHFIKIKLKIYIVSEKIAIFLKNRKIRRIHLRNVHGIVPRREFY